mgnify:CR=1 FL=1
MIKIALLIIIFILNASYASIFTSKDGRTVDASIIEYESDNNTVKLKRLNGKIFSVPVDIFIDDDKNRILQWAKQEDFLNPKIFNIELLPKKLKEKENIDGFTTSGDQVNDAIEKQKQYIAYEITLDNNSSILNDSFTFDYCIYYEVESLDDQMKKYKRERYKKGSEIKQISGKQEISFATSSIILERTSFNTTDYLFSGGMPTDTQDEIKGIWLKIYFTNKEKNEVIREIYYPKSLKGKVKWN